MKYLKLFEEYKVDNITEQDIINAIENNGKIKVSSVKDYPEHNKEQFVRPVDIDGNSIIIDIDDKQYSTSLKFITKMEYFSIDESKNEIDLIIPKGHELFHGTVEDFDINKIDTGSYDGILWTSEDSAISQTYIPVSGITSYTTTEYFRNPIKGEPGREKQRQLGIIYDYSEVEFNNRGIAISYKTPEMWVKGRDVANEWWSSYQKLDSEFREKKSLIVKINNEFINTEDFSDKAVKEHENKLRPLKEEVDVLAKKVKKMEDEYHVKSNTDYEEFKYINDKLKELGYKPDEGKQGNNYQWELKTKYTDNGAVILPADYRAQGRLIIIKPKEDLKIYNYAQGRESDLSEPDYHKVDLFRKVEKAGYDGIKITDFAQIESEGNFGHDSIGLFKSTIPKLDITSIPTEHPKDFGENHVKTQDYESKEYKEYKHKKS